MSFKTQSINLEVQSMHISERIPYREFIDAEIEIAEGSENSQETEEEIGHKPTRLEKFLHFMHTGKDRCLMAALGDKNIFFAGTQFGKDPLSLPPGNRILALFAHFKRYHRVRRHCTLRTIS